MESTSWVVAVSALALVGALAEGCNKAPSATDAPSPAASAANAPAPSVAAVVPDSAVLTGFDPCLVGTWKATAFNLKTAQVTAEGGANLSLKVADNGESVADFAPMSPVVGKGAGAGFDFQYTGQATGTLTTPTRGTVASAKSDYSKLRVSANVQIPGAGKIALFKDKPVSELTQILTGVAAGKAPAAAPPPGIDSSPIFSNSRYTCAGDTLNLSGDKIGADWAFRRVSH